MVMHWPWIKLFWRNKMDFFPKPYKYVTLPQKEEMSPKQYGQSLQQKKRGNGKRKKRVKGK